MSMSMSMFNVPRMVPRSDRPWIPPFYIQLYKFDTDVFEISRGRAAKSRGDHRVPSVRPGPSKDEKQSIHRLFHPYVPLEG